MKTCSVDGCDRKYAAKGYCGSHYQSLHRRRSKRVGAHPVNLTHSQIAQQYGPLIDEAVRAFQVDASYSADIVKSAKKVQARLELKQAQHA